MQENSNVGKWRGNRVICTFMHTKNVIIIPSDFKYFSLIQAFLNNQHVKLKFS